MRVAILIMITLAMLIVGWHLLFIYFCLCILTCDSNEVIYFLFMMFQPGLHLHGHVSEARGVLPAAGHFPLTLNSCICDKAAEVVSACAQVVSASASHPATLSLAEEGASASAKSVWYFTIGALE